VQINPKEIISSSIRSRKEYIKSFTKSQHRILCEMLTDAVAMVTQEAELNELRATIELLRQQGHAHLTPFRRVSTPYKDVPGNGRLSRGCFC